MEAGRRLWDPCFGSLRLEAGIENVVLEKREEYSIRFVFLLFERREEYSIRKVFFSSIWGRKSVPEGAKWRPEGDFGSPG